MKYKNQLLKIWQHAPAPVTNHIVKFPLFRIFLIVMFKSTDPMETLRGNITVVAAWHIYKYILTMCSRSKHSNLQTRMNSKKEVKICYLSMSVFIFRTNTTFRRLYILLSSITCLRHFWPSSGRFYNNLHRKEYWGGGVPLPVNTLKDIKCKLSFPVREVMVKTG